MSQKSRAGGHSSQITGNENNSIQIIVSCFSNLFNREKSPLSGICEALKNFFLEKDKEVSRLKNDILGYCHEIKKLEAELKEKSKNCETANRRIQSLLRLPPEDRNEQFVLSLIEDNIEFTNNEEELSACRAASEWVKIKKKDWTKAIRNKVLDDNECFGVLNSDKKINVFDENICLYLEWLRVALLKGHVYITSISLDEIADKSQENDIPSFVYRVAFNYLKKNFVKDKIPPEKLPTKASKYMESFLDSLISIF